MDTNELKKQAAYRAVDEVLQSGNKVGLGTGSTAEYAVHRLAERLQAGELSGIQAVVTSTSTRDLCHKLHIPVFSLNDSRIQGQVDCAIDGADEVNPANQLIKGGGGAHLFEKIVEYNAQRFYVIVDESKLVSVLNRAFPLPLEIIPEARTSLIRQLERENFSLRLRMKDSRPSQTDSGNQILDIFAPSGEGMETGGSYDPIKMEAYFSSLPGVVESGMFTRPIDRLYIGTENGVVVRN